MLFKPSTLHRSITSALALATCMTIGFATSAQEVDEKEDKGLLEKITVTAQKRVENLNEVPVAVSVLREDQINAAFSANIEGLQALVPSVSFRKGNTNRNSAITIRGIGTISFSVAAEPSVSTVVDGVVLGRSGQAFIDLYDLQRIEVLRGPQGTLFGKNASAGVVNITTKRPSDVFEGSFEASLYQGREYRLKTSMSGPLSDNVSGSVTVLKSQYDGYIQNVYNNEKTNGYDKEGVRAMLDIEAAGETDMLFIFENMKSNDNCCADLELTPSGRHPDSEALPNSTGSGDFDLEQRKIDHDFETRTLDETTGFSLQIDRPIGSHEFTSITAFRSWDNTELREGDFTSIGGHQPLPTGTFLLHDTGIQNWKQTSQEFRIASPIGNALDYQVGFFWWNQRSERNFTRDASCSGDLTSTIQTYLSEQLGQDSPTAEQANDYIAQQNISCNRNDIVSATAYMDTEFDNWALFADGKYHVNDDLRILFGARFTEDEVSFSHNRASNDEYKRGGIGVRNFSTDFDGKTDKTNFSVKLGGQYDLSDESMTYFTYSQGYKGPAFNVFYNMNTPDTLPIGEETSDAYELGYKFANRDVVFNTAIFRTEIDGFQANNPELLDGVTVTRLTNAGSLTTQGVEADLLWQVNDRFTLSGGFSSVKAEVDEFKCPVGASTCTGSSGADLPFSPDLKYSVVGEYSWDVDDMRIILNGSYVYTDEIFAGAPGAVVGAVGAPGNNREALLPDYGILSASLAFSFNDDAYRVSIIGKNLTDESFITTYSGDGFRYQIPRDADRYFGVQLRANFF